MKNKHKAAAHRNPLSGTRDTIIRNPIDTLAVTVRPGDRL